MFCSKCGTKVKFNLQSDILTKKKGFMKIIKLISCIIIVTFLLIFINAIFGNPVSKYIVKKEATNYIEDKYPNNDYNIEKLFYSFKDSRYHVFIKSNSSKDTYFSVSYDSMGNIIYDNFNTLVKNKHNTYDRINTKYSKKVENILNKLSYKSDIDYGQIQSSDYTNEMINFGIDISTLELDKKYDIYELGKKYGSITYYVYDKEVSENKIKEILLNLKKEFDLNKTSFYTVNIYLKNIEGFETKKYDKKINIESYLYRDINEETIDSKIKESIIRTKEHNDKLEKEGY